MQCGPLLFVKVGPDDQVDQPRLVLQRDEQMPLGRGRGLTHDYQARGLDELARRLGHQLGRTEHALAAQSLPPQPQRVIIGRKAQQFIVPGHGLALGQLVQVSGNVRRFNQRIFGVLEAAQRPEQLPLGNAESFQRAGPDQVTHQRPRQPGPAAEIGEIDERPLPPRGQQARPPAAPRPAR